MRRGTGALSSIAAIVTIASVVACTSLAGLTGGEEPVTAADGGGDGASGCSPDLQRDHDNCGACGNVCGEIEHCLAGQCAPGCPNHTVYVSADGNDNASGCTTGTPKRTVGAAIALLKTLGAQQHEVHVCRGRYEESILLDYPASLMGGFECTTWKRSDKYGAPTFDAVNESLLTGGASGPPLTVTKVAGVTIDGFTIRAKDADSATHNVGVLVTENAQPKLSNDKIAGGGGQIAISPGSIGIMVDALATLEVDRCVVEGGSATNTTGSGYGSAGIYLTSKAGNAHVVESRVDGGSGRVSGGTGSVGVHALGGSLAGGGIERSTINGGKGRTDGIGSASIGVNFFTIQVADVDITGSKIDGGAGTCGGDCGVTGVSVTTKGRVKIHDNRVYGGDIVPDTVQNLRFTGMRVLDAAVADVQNNFVFSGNGTNRYATAATAFNVDRGNTAFVANNTFALGPSLASGGNVVTAQATKATFANDVFIRARTTGSLAAVSLDACNPRTYELRGNAWVGFADAALLLSIDRTETTTCTRGAITATTTDALETAAAGAFGEASVGGNRRVAATCGADVKCTAVAACSTAVGCLQATLTTWDTRTAGDLIEGGWKLKDGVVCGLSRGGLDLAGLLATDGFGAARTSPRSIGAHEHDGACQ
ncbi:MAG: hypothetical protein KF819_07830 [Labilithrix sp.]|nr:hypothetical protein [Labilithrix sp.]